MSAIGEESVSKLDPIQQQIVNRFSDMDLGGTGLLGASSMFTETELDITEEFYGWHDAIDNGQLIISGSTNLFEAMQAIELMDPKMDSGMVNKPVVLTPVAAVKQGVLSHEKMSTEEMIAVFDATLATVVTWLEGNALAHTVTTNYYMHIVSCSAEGNAETKDIRDRLDPKTKTFMTGILILLNICKDTIEQACVAEEEDFNGNLCDFDLSLPWSITKWMQSLREVDESLQKQMRKVKAELQNQETPDEEKEKAVMRFSAIGSRFTLIRQLVSALCAMLPVIESNMTSNNDASKTKDVTPDLADADRRLRLVEEVIDWVEKTIPLGLQPDDPEAGDGDYSWLSAFEPDLNRLKLPPSFPRKTRLYGRQEAIAYIRNLVRRLQLVCITLPQRKSNLLHTLAFMRSFGHNRSCVLSRSALQLAYLPVVESDKPTDVEKRKADADFSLDTEPLSAGVATRIMGVLPFAECVRDSICKFVYLPALNTLTGRAAHAWHFFVDDCCRVLLYVITAVGHNKARQPEKLAVAFKQLAVLQQGAESTDVIVHEQLQHENVLPANCHNLSIANHFVIYHILQSVKDYFELFIELQLLAPFEYSWVYWYLGEIVFRQLSHTVDICGKISMDQINAEEERQTAGAASSRVKSQKAQRVKQKRESERLRQIYMRTEQVMHLQALHTACLAMWHTMLGVEKLGVLGVPREQDAGLRYTHRMQPLQCLQCPQYFTYEQYEQCSRQAVVKQRSVESILGVATDFFNDCRNTLQQLQQIVAKPLADECDGLSKVCKNNGVVCRLLASGKLTSAKKVSLTYDFSVHNLIPLIKVVSL